VRWSTSNPLLSWILVGLLSIIALVVILPDDVDLPDTALQSNSSSLAIRSLCQEVPPADANPRPFRLSVQSPGSTPRFRVREIRVRYPEDLPILHASLRC